MKSSYQVVIVGGGAGGLTAASLLRQRQPSLEIAVIDPSTYHYYQPAWTLVGGGAYRIDRTRKRQSRCIPNNVTWIQQSVAAFEPDKNRIVLDDAAEIDYCWLIVAAGIQLDWDKIEGLPATLGKNGVTSNYCYDLAPYTWHCLRQLKSGRALFTQPVMPIKCAGAPQKALYLAADYFRRHRIPVETHFCTTGAAMFGIPFFAQALDEVMFHYGSTGHFRHNLVAIDGRAREAVFEVGENRVLKTMKYDMIHVVPPQSAPDFIKDSPLANETGWVSVDKGTLQHIKFDNIFGLGDCTSTPNSKTAAAVRSQAPVLVNNLLAAMETKPLSAVYDGYAACPVTTSKGKVMLCEFCYGGELAPNLPLDPRIPRRSYWLLKKYYMPWLYWGMVSNGKLGFDRHAKRVFNHLLPDITP